MAFLFFLCDLDEALSVHRTICTPPQSGFTSLHRARALHQSVKEPPQMMQHPEEAQWRRASGWLQVLRTNLNLCRL
ncbi:hypothetical protein K402DRAFT_24645 [Aulographum hederae CBS 113979]|uniref:Uncharacterized protein n=1 Tax=Aulographum hederae CBS 113979 TaxID=1176131 RepID=A0A6G1H5H3_9PEZI|nr:hypothetical protein K402DRAFT_24645 [Aulographum hederae CBS 113979]